jgi:hypothetical protein
MVHRASDVDERAVHYPKAYMAEDEKNRDTGFS